MNKFKRIISLFTFQSPHSNKIMMENASQKTKTGWQEDGQEDKRKLQQLLGNRRLQRILVSFRPLEEAKNLTSQYVRSSSHFMSYTVVCK